MGKGDRLTTGEVGTGALAQPEPADNHGPEMSSAEAMARYLAAIAARAFADEQMRLVADADIVDAAGVAELEQSLAALPPDLVRGLVRAMATNPAMLGEDTLAQLASLLGQDMSVARGRRTPPPAPEPG